MRHQHLVDMLATIDRPGPGLFNPYSDAQEDPEFDVPGGAKIRRQNLATYLGAFESPEVLLVGEAPGCWGAKYSGVAFTSEWQLENKAVPFAGRRTSRLANLARESSATIVWGEVAKVWPRIAQWNTIPYHPHPPGNPMGNRTPTEAEIMGHLHFLGTLVTELMPNQVVAVGRKAEVGLTALGIPHIGVRHPANGGANKFRVSVRQIIASHGIVPTEEDHAALAY